VAEPFYAAAIDLQFPHVDAS